MVLEGNVDDIPIDFKDQVKGEISAALDVDFNQVEVLDVRSGSVPGTLIALMSTASAC